MNNFLKNITYLLQIKNMSWYQLSKRTGIHQSSLADFRNHRKRDIKLDDAITIAKAFDYTIDDLVHKNLEMLHGHDVHIDKDGYIIVCGFCGKKITNSDEIEYSRFLCELYCCPDCATSKYYEYLESKPIKFDEILELI